MTPSTLPRGVALLIGTMAFLACGPERDARTPAVRDSLGVTIIAYGSDFSHLARQAWFLDTAPLYTIGDSGLDLHGVRAALFQSNGGAVIANGIDRQLLLCDEHGRLCARAGRQGGGPGEFRELTSVSVGPGDSVLAYDGREHRLSVFDPDGSFVRAVGVGGMDTLGSAEEIGQLPSGELIAAFRRRTQGTGLVRDSLALFLLDAAAKPVRLLAVIPHLYVDWGPHAVPFGEGTASFPLPVPLSSVTAVALGDGALYVGLPDVNTVVRLGLDGEQRVTRALAPPLAIDEADRERFFASLARSVAGRRSDPRELDALRAIRGPGIRPAFGLEPVTARLGESGLLVTDVGAVWLRPFHLPGDSADLWPMLGADGQYEGMITIPARFRPTSVRGDIVLGVHQDAMDIERVRAYRIRRAAR